MERRGNDPAFSSAVIGADGKNYIQEGMTIREYFAAMATQGLSVDGADAKTIARWAVEQADALIAELNK